MRLLPELQERLSPVPKEVSEELFYEKTHVRVLVDSRVCTCVCIQLGDGHI